MKKSVCVILFVIVCIIAIAVNLPKSEEYDYLRLHIRANSNLKIDQDVKYKIKDEMVAYLTPFLCNVESKQKAIEIIENLKSTIEVKCDDILRADGFNYKSNVKIDNEYFPTRTYANTTLESGYYDAVIVELGDAVGDNWWCVMYPPLCFVGGGNSMEIEYKSRIQEWFKKVFN